MKVNNVKESNGVIKGVFIAYFILLLHILLLAGLGVLILFFRGIVNYMFWIFIAGTGIIMFSAYRFYKKMKKEGKTLKEMMNSPLFRGREVEISLLGGLASLKVGRPRHLLLENNYHDEIKQIESPDDIRLKELSELVRLFENNLITLEEYNQAKKQIFSPN